MQLSVGFAVREISYTHGKVIEEIGYHCHGYFLAQWDRFKGYE
jgi:hypothetical protein